MKTYLISFLTLSLLALTVVAAGSPAPVLEQSIEPIEPIEETRIIEEEIDNEEQIIEVIEKTWSFKDRVSTHRQQPTEIEYQLELATGQFYAELQWNPWISLLGVYLYYDEKLVAWSDDEIERNEPQIIEYEIKQDGIYTIKVEAIERHGAYDLFVKNTIIE